MPIGEVNDLLAHAGTGAKWPSGVRPVDVQFDQCGRLLFSDDVTQSIFTITYDGVSFPAVEVIDSNEVAMDNNSTEMATDGKSTAEDVGLEAEDHISFIPKESTATVMEFQEGQSSSAAASFNAPTTFVASALAAASVVAAAGMVWW